MLTMALHKQWRKWLMLHLWDMMVFYLIKLRYTFLHLFILNAFELLRTVFTIEGNDMLFWLSTDFKWVCFPCRLNEVNMYVCMFTHRYTQWRLLPQSGGVTFSSMFMLNAHRRCGGVKTDLNTALISRSRVIIQWVIWSQPDLSQTIKRLKPNSPPSRCANIVESLKTNMLNIKTNSA